MKLQSEHREVNWLVGFARRLGGRVCILPAKKVEKILGRYQFKGLRQREIAGWHPAPFHHGNYWIGLHWPSKTVITHPGYPYWHNVIHELGHCLATHQNPEAVEETDFLGWEYATVKLMDSELGIHTLETEWFDEMRDYIYQGTPFRQMHRPELMMLEALQFATEYGSVVDGKPVPVR